MLFRWKHALCAAWLLPTSVSANHALDSLLQCHTQPDMPGIAVGIAQAGVPVYRQAMGMADVEEAVSLDVSQVFHIGSISKQFTAAAVLKLVEAGSVKLEDPIGRYLNHLPAAVQEKTLIDLLSHTAGLGDYLGDREVQRRWHTTATTAQVLKHILRATEVGESGQAYRYSNTGYILLGALIEHIAKTTYAQYMHTQFFQPLGMKHSFVVTGESDERTVRGYAGSLDSAARLSAPENVDRSWIHAAGAIASNIADMSLWHQALKSGKVISKAHYQLMTSATALPSGEHINYGLGMDVYPIAGKDTYSHQGAVPGFMAWMVYFEAQDTFGIALSNHGGRHPGPALLDLLARHLQLSPSPLQAPQQAVNPALTGTFSGPDEQTLSLTSESGALFAQQSNGQKTRMLVREQDAFSFPCTENYYQFGRDAGGDYAQYVHIYRGPGAKLYRQQ